MNCKCCGQRLKEQDENLPEEFYIVVRKQRIGRRRETPGELQKHITLGTVYTTEKDARRPFQGMVFKVKLFDMLKEE